MGKYIYKIFCKNTKNGNMTLSLVNKIYRRPETSISLMARKMQGSMRKHVTPLAKIEDDCASRPSFPKMSPAPDCIRIWGVKYSTALMPENCRKQRLRFSILVPINETLCFVTRYEIEWIGTYMFRKQHLL